MEILTEGPPGISVPYTIPLKFKPWADNTIVTPKLMVFVKLNIKPSYGELAAIMLSTQMDQTGHGSHLSDLPS